MNFQIIETTKRNFMSNKILIFICLGFLIFYAEGISYSADFCSMKIRKVINTSDKELIKNAERFSYVDKSGRLESIYVEKTPKIVIPPKLIKDINFYVIEFKDNEYFRNANGPIQLVFDASLRKEKNDFVENNLNKRIAIFVCNKLIASPKVTSLGIPELEEGTDSWMYDYYSKSLDRGIALIKNVGITPKYKDIYAKFGKPTYRNVTKNYKFKTPFDKTREIYPINLSESELWVTQEEAEIYASVNRVSVKLPKGFMVEQVFSPSLSKWEYGKEFIIIENPYGRGKAWIRKNQLVPFFSTLNTDLFLGTFFINNEREWQIINERRATIKKCGKSN